MAIRFIHTSDIHFGVENYGHFDTATGLNTRLIDFRNSFQYIIDYAIKENVDLFIFAGDAYKNSYPSPTHQRILLKLFLQLFEKNIPVVMVVGNHDHPGSVIKAHALDVFYHIKNPLCTIFGKPGVCIVQTKSGPVQIIGLPWPFPILFGSGKRFTSKEIKSIVLEKLNLFKGRLDENIPAILVAHLTMKNGIFCGSEKIIIEDRDPLFTIAEIYDKRIQYTALGHLHKYQYINKKYDDQNPIVYSGSPDRIDFGEREDIKSFCDVTINVGKKTFFTTVLIPCRPFYVINLVINSIQNAKELITEKLLQYPDLKKAIVKIRYSYDDTYIKYIDMSFFQNIAKNVWYLASIECINSYKKKNNEKKEVIYQEKNIYELVELYIEKNEIYRDEKNLYLEMLKRYID